MKKTRTQESVDILPRLERMMDSMTRSEIRIAKRLLESPSEFVRSSVRAVAADLGVSEPTILSFCRAVGCEGFKDLKFRLIQELALTQAMTDQAARAARPVGASELATRRQGSRRRSRVRNHHRGAHAHARYAVEQGFAEQRAGHCKSGARRCLRHWRQFRGAGCRSAQPAVSFQHPDHGLYRRLHPAHVGGDPGEGDVALFISSTGRPRELQESLELAKYYKATCIAITDKDTPLGRDADICLHVGLAGGRAPKNSSPIRCGSRSCS